MRLGEAQELFMELLPLLLNEAFRRGYKIRGGDLFRDARAFGEFGEEGPYGNPRSNHKNKTAIDLNLFKGGQYLSATEDHRDLGEYWETLHPHCRWGGRFEDGNHYELVPAGWRE